MKRLRTTPQFSTHPTRQNSSHHPREPFESSPHSIRGIPLTAPLKSSTTESRRLAPRLLPTPLQNNSHVNHTPTTIEPILPEVPVQEHAKERQAKKPASNIPALRVPGMSPPLYGQIRQAPYIPNRDDPRRNLHVQPRQLPNGYPTHHATQSTH